MLAAGRATEVGGEFSHAVLLHSLRIIGHRFWAPGVAQGRTVLAPVRAQDLTRRHRGKHYPARLEVALTPDYRKSGKPPVLRLSFANSAVNGDCCHSEQRALATCGG